jgi:hypothetical protein
MLAARLGLGLTRNQGAFQPADLFLDGDQGGYWDARSLSDSLIDQPVDSWADTVNAHAMAQAVGGRQPTLRAQGSKRWLEFDVDDMDEADVLGDCLLGEFAVSTADLTIIVAAHNEDETGETGSEGNRRSVCLKVPQAASAERDLNIHHNLAPYTEPDPDLNGALGMRHPENAAVHLPVEGNNALAEPGVVVYQRNGTAIQDAWIDGAAQARVTTTTTTFTSTHLGIGYGLTTSLAFNTDGAGHWIGKIGSVLVIDRVLSFAEIRKAAGAMRSGLPVGV